MKPLPRRALEPGRSGFWCKIPRLSSGQFAFFLCIVVFLLPGAEVARAVTDLQEDLVPAGVLEATVSTSYETQTKAMARDSQIHGLEFYALPSANSPALLCPAPPAPCPSSLQGLVSGSLSREYRETDLYFKYGLTDHWNISLLLPYVEATQRSSLQSKFPGLNPILDAYVANLQNRTISGPGNYTLTSLHRPLFTDYHALVFGYGYWGALESNTGVYTGIGSFETRVPYGGIFGLVHYTYFSQAVRGRFDARLEYQSPLTDSVNIPTGVRVSVQGGQTAISTLSWAQEPGAFGYGLALIQTTSTQTKLDGDGQEDGVKDYLFHAQLGFGNLIDLEKAPIRFPYQALLTYENTLYGFDTPLRDRWGLLFRTYF